MHDQALLSCDAIHRERRTLLKQEIGRMVLFFTDQPSLLAPNIQVHFVNSITIRLYEMMSIISYFSQKTVVSLTRLFFPSEVFFFG